MGLSNRTPAGRAEIDKAVTKALKRHDARGAIAFATGLEATIVSASLRRLVAARIATVTGLRSKARYTLRAT